MQNQRKITNYLKYLETKNYSLHTIACRKKVFKKFQRFLNSRNLQIQDIVEEDIFDYKIMLLKKYKPSTISTHLSGLKSFYTWLFKNNYVFINPAQNIQTSLFNNRLPEVLTVREMTELLNSLPQTTATAKRNKALLELAYSSLLRREELIRLNVADLNFDEMTVRVKRKGKKEAILPFGKCAGEALKDYLQNERPNLLGQGDSNALWIAWRTKDRMKYSSIDDIFKQIKKKLGISISLHTFRRSGATHMIQNGASLVMVQEMLSHENLQAVKHYLKLDVKDLKQTLSKSEKLK